MNEPHENPMEHPPEQSAGSEGSPKFWQLLTVLLLVVLFLGALTLASEAYFSK